MPNSLLSQLSSLRRAFSEVAPDNQKVINDYCWIIVKALLQHIDEIDSLTARQLLADCIMQPIERPSKLHSALLSAAITVANTYPEFHFATFFRMWDINNLRPEDHERQRAQDGKTFPSLVERTAKALAHSLLLHPEDRHLLQETTVPDGLPSGSTVTAPNASASGINSLIYTHSLSILPMLVTRIKQAAGKDGRKYTFVTLTSPEGIEVECTSHNLQPSPLHPLPEGKRHYINIGQLYDCLLQAKVTTIPVESTSVPTATVPSNSSLVIKEAYLSQNKVENIFPTEIGYIEHIDQEHAHMHIYDCHSRHFVAPIQRFSREKEGDFVRFIPIIPVASKFKTAIILTTVPSSSEQVKSILREIRITSINSEKGYAAWELVNKEHPITELLSPFQLSQGETSPSFTSGYLSLDEKSSLALSSYTALIYLKRGKDRQKRPHVAKLLMQNDN